VGIYRPLKATFLSMITKKTRQNVISGLHVSLLCVSNFAANFGSAKTYAISRVLYFLVVSKDLRLKNCDYREEKITGKKTNKKDDIQLTHGP